MRLGRPRRDGAAPDVVRSTGRVLRDASADDSCLSLREGRLAAQALGPDRRLCRFAAQPASTDEALPDPSLLRVGDAGIDQGKGVALVYMVQTRFPLVGDGVSISGRRCSHREVVARGQGPHVWAGRRAQVRRARVRTR